MGKETAPLVILALAIAAAALVMAIVCLLMTKFGKHFITARDAGRAALQSAGYALVLTAIIAVASIIHMYFFFGGDYRGYVSFRGPDHTFSNVLTAISWPAFWFFCDVATSFFWINRMQYGVSGHEVLRKAITPLGLSLIFAFFGFVFFYSNGWFQGSFAPAAFLDYYVGNVLDGAGVVWLVVADFQAGWAMLWGMFDVHGNFFLLTGVMSTLFVVIAIFTGVGLIRSTLDNTIEGQT